jgi:hypothetical protein
MELPVVRSAANRLILSCRLFLVLVQAKLFRALDLHHTSFVNHYLNNPELQVPQLIADNVYPTLGFQVQTF